MTKERLIKNIIPPMIHTPTGMGDSLEEGSVSESRRFGDMDNQSFQEKCELNEWTECGYKKTGAFEIKSLFMSAFL